MQEKTGLNLPIKPMIPKYYYFVDDGDTIQVRSPFRTLKLTGESVKNLLPNLLPDLDGSKTVKQIINNLRQKVDEDVISDALEVLNKNGLLEDASIEPSVHMASKELDFYQQQITFFSQLTKDKYKYQGLLKKSKAMIIGLGLVGSQVLHDLIMSGVGEIIAVDNNLIGEKDVSMGIFYSFDDMSKLKVKVLEGKIHAINPYISFKGIDADIKSVEDMVDVICPCDLVILCSEKPIVSLYQWLNEVCLEKEIIWTRACVNAFEAIIGPSIVPHQTPCYHCYELRKKSNIPLLSEYITFENHLRENPNNDVEIGSLSPFVGIAGSFIALEAIRILTGFSYPVTFASEYIVNFFSLEVTRNEILRLPRCPVCGTTRKSPTRKVWNL